MAEARRPSLSPPPVSTAVRQLSDDPLPEGQLTHSQPLVGPLNRRLSQLRGRLPAALQGWVPDIPPATPRNLWLLLALLVATQNVTVFHAVQSDQAAVLALLCWGGALICMEDQLEDLRPAPGLVGLVFGSILLIWVLARTAVILHVDGILFALPPLAGLALALLCQPLARVRSLRDPLLCLALIPAFHLLSRFVVPERALSLVTADGSAFWLSILGFDVVVDGRRVMLAGGGVSVAGACNGIEIISMLICISIIFLLAFRVRSIVSRTLLLLAAPLIAWLSNTIRIAFLAFLTTMGQGQARTLFDFFHEEAGSLLFSGVAVFLYGLLYTRLLERELPPLPPAPPEAPLS